MRYDGNLNLANTDVGDGVKFRGRGFKQLTGRYNYSEYLVYRGWLDTRSYDHAWFKNKVDGRYINGPKIDDPQYIGNDEYSCVDTAGFFCVRHSIAKSADRGANERTSIMITKIVNPFDKKSPPLRWK
jgi:predicted chitinase